VKVVKAGLASAPKDPGLLMNLALATEAAGDKPGAIKAYADAVAAQPKNMELRFAYAENLAAAGKPDDAMAQLRQITADDPKLLAAMGDLYARMHKFSDCVGALDKAIQAKDVPGLHVLRGRCRHGMKDAAGEKADYEAAAKLDDRLAEPHFYLGQLYKDQGKKKEALAEFKKAATLGAGKKVGEAAKKAIAAVKAGK
jgi:tetratricopeptide (TPR) repeat protein